MNVRRVFWSLAVAAALVLSAGPAAAAPPTKACAVIQEHKGAGFHHLCPVIFRYPTPINVPPRVLR